MVPFLPSDLIDVLKWISPDPMAWFIGQFVKFILRPKPWLEKELELLRKFHPGTSQCSKIRKKCNFKSTKIHFCYFKNGKKSIFAPEKSPKIAFLNFFLVQKFIFCHF